MAKGLRQLIGALEQVLANNSQRGGGLAWLLDPAAASLSSPQQPQRLSALLSPALLQHYHNLTFLPWGQHGTHQQQSDDLYPSPQPTQDSESVHETWPSLQPPVHGNWQVHSEQGMLAHVHGLLHGLGHLGVPRRAGCHHTTGSSLHSSPAGTGLRQYSSAADGQALPASLPAAAAPPKKQGTVTEAGRNIAAARKLMRLVTNVLVSKGASGVCVVGSLLLYELLLERSIASTIRQGYLGIRRPGLRMFWVWHVWLEVEGHELDVGQGVFTRHMLRIGGEMAAAARSTRCFRLRELPTGEVLERHSDHDETLRLWAAFERDNYSLHGYWALVPKHVSGWRTAVLRRAREVPRAERFVEVCA